MGNTSSATGVMKHVIASPVIVLLLLVGCAQSPIQSSQPHRQISPIQAASDPTGTILWGGVIVQRISHEESTTLEVLSYPLGNLHQPLVSLPASGRFLIRQADAEEAQRFVAGRHLTVEGTLNGTLEGSVAGHSYAMPVVEPLQMHLWSLIGHELQPRVSIGVGFTWSN